MDLGGRPTIGWWYTYPSEKHESQLGSLFPYIMERKNHIPNHQPNNDDLDDLSTSPPVMKPYSEGRKAHHL